MLNGFIDVEDPDRHIFSLDFEVNPEPQRITQVTFYTKHGVEKWTYRSGQPRDHLISLVNGYNQQIQLEMYKGQSHPVYVKLPLSSGMFLLTPIKNDKPSVDYYKVDADNTHLGSKAAKRLNSIVLHHTIYSDDIFESVSSIAKYLTTYVTHTDSDKRDAISLAKSEGLLKLIWYLTEYKAHPYIGAAEEIHIAINNGYMNLVDSMVGAEGFRNIYRLYNYAIKLAAQKNNLQMVKYFHQHGATLKDEYGSVMKIAIENDNMDIVKYLVESGADLKDENYPPLGVAAANCRLNIIKYLHYVTRTSSKENATPKDQDNIITAFNNVAIRSAACVEVAKYLVEYGADVTAQDNEALIKAVRKRNFELMQFLVESGADVTAQDNEAISIAILTNDPKILKYLHEHGAYLPTPENVIEEVMHSKYMDILVYLHEHRATLLANSGLVLNYAARFGYLDVIQYLVEHGADVTVQNNEALLIAVRNNNFELIQYLVEHGADLTVLMNGHVFSDLLNRYVDDDEHFDILVNIVQYLLDMDVFPTEFVRNRRSEYLKIQQLLDNYEQNRFIPIKGAR